MSPTLAVGRTVLFVLPVEAARPTRRAGESRPAVVTAVHPGDRVNLTIFLDQPDDVPNTSILVHTARAAYVLYDAGGKPGTWRWPLP